MLLLKLTGIFLGAALASLLDIMDSHSSIISRQKTDAMTWGFLSWFLGGLVFATVLVDPQVPVFFGLIIGGIGAGVGNTWGIRGIRLWKKTRKKRTRFARNVVRVLLFKKSRSRKRRRSVRKRARMVPKYEY